MTESDAFNAGYDVYWDGVDPEDNPFMRETFGRRAWEEGWAQAESEDVDEGDTA